MSKQTYSIVGTHFRGKQAEEILKNLKPGTALHLVREPENKFDKNAVAVYVGGDHIGYIPKEKAAVLSPQIERDGHAWTKPVLVDSEEARADSAIIRKAIDGEFFLSPNSAFPQIRFGE